MTGCATMVSPSVSTCRFNDGSPLRTQVNLVDDDRWNQVEATGQVHEADEVGCTGRRWFRHGNQCIDSGNGGNGGTSGAGRTVDEDQIKTCLLGFLHCSLTNQGSETAGEILAGLQFGGDHGTQRRSSNKEHTRLRRHSSDRTHRAVVDTNAAAFACEQINVGYRIIEIDGGNSPETTQFYAHPAAGAGRRVHDSKR